MDNFDLKKFLGKKSLLNENAPGYDTRKFGEALPTLESVKAAHEAKGEGYKEYEDGVEKEKLAKAGDLKEEADPLMKELKRHYEAYQDGTIDGDDLANALGEILGDNDMADEDAMTSIMMDAPDRY